MILLVIPIALFATLFVGAVLHELSHSLAGVLMGFRVEEIRFGSGPVLMRTGLGRTAIELRLFPGEGLVQHLRPVGRFKRIRTFVFIAAGPACDVLLLMASIWLRTQPGLSEYWSVGLTISICVQAYWTLSNLLPRVVEIGDTTMPNDALRMVQVLFNRYAGMGHRKGQLAIEHLIYEGMIKRYLQPDEPIPEMSKRSQEMLDYYVNCVINKEHMGPDMIARLDAALSGKRPAAEEIMLLDTLLTGALAKIDPQGLADMDRWSARALELGAHIPTVKASRGSVLIEIGRPAEGLALLSDGLNGEPHNDCLVHAFRALGHFKLGDLRAADAEFAEVAALFKHEDWQGQDIRLIVERVARTIGIEFKSPATWSVEAARAAFRNRTSGQPAQPDRP